MKLDVDLEAQVVITPSEDSNQKQKKESEEKVEESQTTNGKKNPYDLRNKTQEKTSNFYNNDKIGEAINMKNEYEFSKSLSIFKLNFQWFSYFKKEFRLTGTYQ